MKSRILYVIFPLFLLVLITNPLEADETYHMVMVSNPDQTTITTMLELGLPMDDSKMIPGQGLEIPLEEADIALLRRNGISYSITQEDLEAYYARICRENMKQIPSYQTDDPVHMKHGSMGGFYTFQEIVMDLDSMRLLYPNLITVKDSIGAGHEGNPLWMVKISDNPDITENEPSGIFDALHHAREPGAYTVLIYAMWHLLEEYGADPEATYLVNNRELYFVPVVNPDGFLYNIQTNPGGGGMWRKNRRDNGGGVYGVDPNRNYPYQWGYDNQGSSPTPSSSTYRGPSAGSEPEVQAMMNFINARNFVTGMTIHTSAFCYLTAYGYDLVMPEPLDVHMEYLAEAARYNGYDYGTCRQIMYASNGRTQDWQLHEQGIINIEPEVGSHGFWPSIQYIIPEAAENLHCCLNLFWCAGGKVELSSVEVADGYLSQGDIDTLMVEIYNRGYGTSEIINLQLASNDPYITILNANSATDTIPRRSGAFAGFRVETASACPIGHEAAFTLTIDQGGFLLTEEFTLRVGVPTVYFEDDMESGVGGWTHLAVTTGWEDQWHLSTMNSHSPTHAWKFGSPGGDYANHADGGLVTQTINIGINGELTFWHWIEAEASGAYPDSAYDGGVVEISHNGAPFTLLPMPGYTHHIRASAGGGNPYTGPFTPQIPVFSGSSGGWVEETADLSDYPGDIQLRFRFGSDNASTAAGWFIDDVRVTAFPSGTTPNLMVELTPLSPPIQIPTSGGSFSLRAEVSNNTARSITFDAWTEAILPGGNVYGPIVLRNNLLIPPGYTIMRQLLQNVPGYAPAGSYTYVGKVGVYPDSVIDDDSFPFTKIPGEAAPTHNQGWNVYGWDNDEEGFRIQDSGFGIISVNPNPFNPETALSYKLQAASNVKLAVYDIAGREVALLAEGFYPAGTHQAVWDASAMASGVYFARLQAGDEVRTVKMLLVK